LLTTGAKVWAVEVFEEASPNKKAAQASTFFSRKVEMTPFKELYKFFKRVNTFRFFDSVNN
jgi:uncharacterized protein YcbX